MPHFTTGGLILIVLVALLLFGPSKLPELGRAFGRTLREFKAGARDVMEDEPQPERKQVHPEQEARPLESRPQETKPADSRLPE